MIDTHVAYRRLIAAGMSPEVAEVQTELLREIAEESGRGLATKGDLVALESSLMSKIYFALLAHMGATVALAAGLALAIVKLSH
jgi:hypothetical protein